MRIDPALRALRGDPASQRRAQKLALSVRDAWQALPQVADMLGDLAAYGRGECLRECGALDAVFEPSATTSFVAGFFATMAAAVRAQPLAQLPFRHSLSNGHAVIHLAQAGRATLALVVLEAGARPSPQTIAFADCERTETVVCGQAAGQIVSRNARGNLEFESREFQAGNRITYGAASSRLVRSVASDLVSLRLSRSPAAPLP